MSFLNLIDRAIRQVRQKQEQALKQFSEGLVKVQISENNRNHCSSLNVAQNSVGNAENQDNESSGIDEEVYEVTEKNLNFFERIMNKNSRAMKDFEKKIDRVKIQQTPTDLALKAVPKLEPAVLTTHKIPTIEPSESIKNPLKTESKLLKIFVKNLAGKIIYLKALPTESIYNLKSKIQDSERISTDMQNLIFEGIKLDDQRLIEDYNIQNESTCHLIHEKMPTKPEPVQKIENKISIEPQKSAEFRRLEIVKTPNKKKPHYLESLLAKEENDSEQNPQNGQLQKQMTAKEVLQELQEIHRQRSIQRSQRFLGRSINKRSKIIQIGSEMQNMEKEKKQKQAEQKIKVNIEFLESMRVKPVKRQTNFKEFNNIRSQDNQKMKQSIRIKTIKRTGFSNNHYNQHQLGSMTEEVKASLGRTEKFSLNDSNIFVDSRLKLPEISSKKGPPKPKPYSIYNLSQKGSEIFVHK